MRARDQALKARDVDSVFLDAQNVARRTGLQDSLGVRADVRRSEATRACSAFAAAARPLTPQRVDQTVGADRLTGVQQQHRQQRAELRPADRHLRSAPPHLQRTEQPKLELVICAAPKCEAYPAASAARQRHVNTRVHDHGTRRTKRSNQLSTHASKPLATDASTVDPAAGEAAARDTLARWYEAWNAHNVDAISALMTDDVTLRGPGGTPTRHARSRRRHADVGRAFAGIPDLHLEKLEEWVTQGGDVIASYFRFSGTFAAELTAPRLPPLAPTGGRLEILGMDRSEIRDERLARHQIFWDIAELSRQLGALPLRGSRAERIARHLQRLTARRLRATH